MRKRLLIEIAIPDHPPTVRFLCAPPFPDVNPIFAAGAHALLSPQALAVELGMMSDKGAEATYAMVYAEGVILSSPTEGFADFGREDWKRWLVGHPVHFEELRDLIDCRKNWEEPDGPGGAGDGGTEGHPDAGTPPQ